MNTNATEFHPKNHHVMNTNAPMFTPKNKVKHREQNGENVIHIANTDKEFTPKKLKFQTLSAPETPKAPSTSTNVPNEADKQKESSSSQHDSNAAPVKAAVEEKEVATVSPKAQTNEKQSQLPAGDEKKESKETQAATTTAETTLKHESHSPKRAKESTATKKDKEKQQNQKADAPVKKDGKTTSTPTPTPTPTLSPTPPVTPPVSASPSPTITPATPTDSPAASQPKMSYAERMKLGHANKQKQKELEEQERIKNQQRQQQEEEEERAAQEKARKRGESQQQRGGRNRYGGRNRDISTSPAPRTSTPTQMVKPELSPPLRTGSPSAAATRGRGRRRDDGEPHLFSPKPVIGATAVTPDGAERADGGMTPPPPSRSAKYPSEQANGSTPPPAAPTLDTLEAYERRTVVNYKTIAKYQKMFTGTPADFDNFLYLLNQFEHAYVAPQLDTTSVLSDAELCMRSVTTLLNQMTDKNVAATAKRLTLLEIDRVYPPSNATLIGEFCERLVAKAASEPKVFTASYAELVRRLVAFPRFSGIRRDILINLQKKMKNPPAEVKASKAEETKQLKYCQREYKDAQDQAAQNAVRDYRGCCRFIGYLIKKKVFTLPICRAVINDCFSLDPLPTSVVLSGMEEFLGVVLDAWVKDPLYELGQLLEEVFARIEGVYRKFPKIYYFRFDDLMNKFSRHQQSACATPTPGLDEELHAAAATPGLPGASEIAAVRHALGTADGLVGLVEESGHNDQCKVIHDALLCAVEADDRGRTAGDVVAQLKKLLLPETISADQVIKALFSVCAEAPYLSVPLAQLAERAGRCLALVVREGVVSCPQLVGEVLVPLSKRALDEARVPAEQRDATARQVRECGAAGVLLGPMLTVLGEAPECAAQTVKELAECTGAFFNAFGEEVRSSFVRQCAFIKQHGLERLFPEYATKERVLALLSVDTIDEAKLKDELACYSVERDDGEEDDDDDDDNTAWYTACFTALLNHSSKDATPEKVKEFATSYRSVITCLVPKNRLEIAFCFFDAIEHFFSAQDAAEAFFTFFIEMEIVIVPGFQQWTQQRKDAVNDYTEFIQQLSKQYSQQQRKRIDFA